MNVEFFYAGVYRKPEKITQYLQHYMLYLALSGFDYIHLCDASRRKLQFPEAITQKIPFLALFPPGITIDFSANEKRESWAIMFRETTSELSPETFPCSYMKFPLIPFLTLPQNKIFHLRQIFSEITDYLASGSPAGLAKAKLQVCAILAELLPEQKKTVHNPNAEALKNAIDSDEHFQISLNELCRRSGPYSVLYMRKLFYTEYGMLPGEYRDKKRLNRILELFAQTDDSLKMIADEVGMKHLPHLYAFLKRHRNLTPKQLLLQFRGTKSSC